MNEPTLSPARTGMTPDDYLAQLLETDMAESPPQVTLIGQDADPQSTTQTDQQILEQRSARRAAGQQKILFGALWCIGGILVTAITYSAARGGGTYVIAWGAVLFGLRQLFEGLSDAGA